MSSHPNAILLCHLTVDDLARKTFRDIAEHESADISEGSFEVNIGGRSYTASVMEADYDDSNQISGDEGQVVLRHFLTYGYGERCPLAELNAAIEGLQHWAAQACKRHSCAYEISISANYW
ncbi:hypothetical protein [Novilysobacter erysipheiresistens]|uniref:DUF3240 domain-containing protein n=1 Tax=Novilysobacter erysipheiresistens TaxID=1749332 RepID=A0ABU7YU92_9GAMM